MLHRNIWKKSDQQKDYRCEIICYKLRYKEMSSLYLYVIFKGHEKDFFFDNHIKAYWNIYSTVKDYLFVLKSVKKKISMGLKGDKECIQNYIYWIQRKYSGEEY